MVETISSARARAEILRFSGDLATLGAASASAGIEARDYHYQDAIEISAALTPSLWHRLNEVCERLRMPTASVAAFIYSSPNMQAACLSSGGNQCTVRFSSAMVDLLTEEEFEFVIGHEIGHFLFNHRPISADRSYPQAFVQQRSQEISADRVGLIACASLETALRALMKTVSGLTERHLRFDVAAFISQLKKIETDTPDWSGSTHPSILIRAKALLWLSLAEFFGREPESWSSEKLALLDRRVEKDLQRFVDGAIKKQIDDAKKDLLLWTMAYEIMQTGAFTKNVQTKMKQIFGNETVDKLLLFIGDLTQSELDEVIYGKVKSTRSHLETLIPETFEVEIRNMKKEVDAVLN